VGKRLYQKQATLSIKRVTHFLRLTPILNQSAIFVGSEARRMPSIRLAASISSLI